MSRCQLSDTFDVERLSHRPRAPLYGHQKSSGIWGCTANDLSYASSSSSAAMRYLCHFFSCRIDRLRRKGWKAARPLLGGDRCKLPFVQLAGQGGCIAVFGWIAVRPLSGGDRKKQPFVHQLVESIRQLSHFQSVRKVCCQIRIRFS